MSKVIVFDSGGGAGEVAKYIRAELPVLEVEEVAGSKAIETRHTKYGICMAVEGELLPYIFKADLIVLGGFVVSQAVDFLSSRYPDQRFVAVECDLKGLSERMTHNVMILAENRTKRTWQYRQLKTNFKDYNVLEPRCAKWNELIYESEKEIAISLGMNLRLRNELTKYKEGKIDTVVIMSTYFAKIENDLLEVLGRQIWIVDFKEKLREDISQALELEGECRKFYRKRNKK